MRKTLILIFICVSILMLAGCGNKDNGKSGTVSQQLSVEEVLQQGIAAADSAVQVPTETAPAQPMVRPTAITDAPTPEVSIEDLGKIVRTDENDVDIDLTQMSSTMIYAEVYSIMSKPEDFVGKKIRMRGDYSYFYDKYSDQYYFACLIRDATACCAQGLEFVLNADYSFPKEYPKSGDEVTITGDFESYKEGDFTFYHLANAVWEK